jgi:2-amino-4-hydroxy-6-hydroxymethyldihydropteridine diphosphokinase
METVYLGLGANLGDRGKNIEEAIGKIKNLPQTEMLKASTLYETEPVGHTAQPKFLNSAIAIKTKLSPMDLLRQLKKIEKELGREDTFRFGPRLIDIDILFFGDQKLSTPELTIPHPRITERYFVLRPLMDIVPALVHSLLPTLSAELRELLKD